MTRDPKGSPDVLAAELAALGIVCKWNEPLSAHTTYQIGGPADLFVVAESEEQLIAAIHATRAREVPLFLLGGGSNVLVSDRGIRGLVIQYRGAAHTFQEREGETVLWTEAGAPLAKLARESIDRGLEGIEWAVDVPGTVGGAVIGNAGAYGGYICDSLSSVRTLEPDGTVHELDNAACGFCYRDSKFKQQPQAERSIVLSATCILRAGDRQAITERAAEYTTYRQQRHPAGASCGSVFKRTPNYPAGFLIEQCGLKGAQQGEAVISPQHANYIINMGGARAADVKALIDLAREQVKVQFDQVLELEVQLVGEW